KKLRKDTRKDLDDAEVLWLKEAQRGLIREECKFQFQLYTDGQGLWRCRGRLGNAKLSFNTRHPILLPKSHAFTELVVRRAHFHVLHSGVKDTLTELRRRFWIPGGRSLVWYLIHWCVICRRYNTSYDRPPPPPPLPTYRVQGGLAFSSVGVDYAGPMTIKHYTHTSHNINSHTKSGARNAYTSCEGVIEKTIMGRDQEIRGAVVRLGSGSQTSSFLRRPIQRLYPLEL
uniref:Integrase zinc-binding domain-containing protein n=1 Tax=Amphimedon queenslandica TaxID=400682 RepID=A0A1X7SRX5_AMPQE